MSSEETTSGSTCHLTGSGESSGMDGAREISAMPQPPARPMNQEWRMESGEMGATTGEGDSGLTPERLALIRRRILDGAYDSLDAVDLVARRIIARGDL